MFLNFSGYQALETNTTIKRNEIKLAAADCLKTYTNKSIENEDTSEHLCSLFN